MTLTRRIVLTSGKGGVGKTTVTANLGAQLSRMGYRVLVCDTDIGLNNVDVVMGVEHLIVYDIVDAIEGRCRPKQALVQHTYFKNLYILSSNHSMPDRYISPQAVKLIIDALAPQFDFVLIDCPAGIEDGFHRAVSSAEEALIVTTPHMSSLRDADKVISVLQSYRLANINLVINMARGDMMMNGDILSPREICDILKIPLIGMIPEDDSIFLNDISGENNRAFRLLASNIIEGRHKIYDVTKKYSGIFGSIRRSLKKSL